VSCFIVYRRSRQRGRSDPTFLTSIFLKSTRDIELKPSNLSVLITLSAALLVSVSCSVAAQFVPEAKLVGVGVGVYTGAGQSTALSADGNTAIVGGPFDSAPGTAWVFTRNGVVWTQQGPKLVGAGAVGSAEQGLSVSLSADGNTAIVGGSTDTNNTGAAWVYARNAGVWTQQGAKLVGTGGVGQTLQGSSVSLSGDGNTAIVGGFGDNGAAGAAWVFTRSGVVWTQQGSKLVGTGASGFGGEQGFSAALSADGNTAMLGAPGDSSSGAAWVFTRSAGIWTQQGAKLVGTGIVGGGAGQGNAVFLSGDGNTAIVGGIFDNALSGAAWVFTRSGGVWTQQGPKLVGTGAMGFGLQGSSVSLSGDGNTALVGGPFDNSASGAAWVFNRSGSVWTQQGNKLVSTEGAMLGTSVGLAADGNTAIVGAPLENGLGAAWIYSALPTAVPTAVPALGSIIVVALSCMLVALGLLLLYRRSAVSRIPKRRANTLND
jgi:hypothetical protein